MRTRFWQLNLLIGCTLVALICSAGVANAGANTAKAKQLYDEGVTNYNLGHYDEALTAFEMAYRVRHDPAFLFNIAQCQRQLHRYEDAERSYRAYLRESPGLPATTHDQVQKLIADMEHALEEQRSKQPPTGTQAPATPEPGEAQPAPATPPVQTQPRPTIEVRTISERRPSRPMVIGGLVTAGVGVAALATGIGFGVLAKNASDTLTRNDNARLPFDNAVYQEGRRDQVLEGVFIGVGAAGVVVGTTIAVLGAKRRVSSQAADFRPTSNGLSVRF